jgi:hypothetical protein
MRRASGRYKATKRFSAVLDAEVEEKLRLQLSDMNVKGKFAYADSKAESSCSPSLASIVVRTYHLRLSSASILRCTFVSSIKLYRYYSDDDECKLARPMSGW